MLEELLGVKLDMKVLSHEQFVDNAAIGPEVAPFIADSRLNHFWSHVEESSHVVRSPGLGSFGKGRGIAQTGSFILYSVPKSLRSLN